MCLVTHSVAFSGPPEGRAPEPPVLRRLPKVGSLGIAPTVGATLVKGAPFITDRASPHAPTFGALAAQTISECNNISDEVH